VLYPNLIPDSVGLYDGGLECRFKSEQCVFFWRLSHDGLFFELRTADELLAGQDTGDFDPASRVHEIAEVLATFPDLYRRLGYSESAKLDLAFKWKGAKGRFVASWDSPLSSVIARKANRRIAIEAPSCSVQLPVATRPKDVGPFVVRAVTALFANSVADWQPENHWVLELVSSLVDRRPRTG